MKHKAKILRAVEIDPCTMSKVKGRGSEMTKMRTNMPGLPNTWRYDLQEAQGG